LELGKTVAVRRDGGLQAGVFLTTGASLRYAVKAIDHPLLLGRWGVVSLPLWSEEKKSEIATELSLHGAIVSVEDHLTAGGFGSFLREAVADTVIQSRLKTVSLDASVCGLVGKQDVLNSSGGLDTNKLVKVASSFGLNTSPC